MGKWRQRKLPSVKQDGRYTYNVTLSRLQVTIVVVEKQGIAYSECVSVALVIQLQSSCTILYCHLMPVSLSVQYSSTLSHKRQD